MAHGTRSGEKLRPHRAATNAYAMPGQTTRLYNVCMSSAVDIGSLITRDPSIRGGRPFVAGTGVTVQRIATWYKLGLASEEIADRVGHLTLAQIHAAIAYYHANRDEIEHAIAADDERAAELEAKVLPRQQ